MMMFDKGEWLTKAPKKRGVYITHHAGSFWIVNWRETTLPGELWWSEPLCLPDMSGLKDHRGIPIAKEFIDRHKDGERCHSSRDGECNDARCPQLRDGEPQKSGRHCPLDSLDSDEE